MKDIIEALAEKAADEEFMDRVAIAVLPELIKEMSYQDACIDAYHIADLFLEVKKGE